MGVELYGELSVQMAADIQSGVLVWGPPKHAGAELLQTDGE